MAGTDLQNEALTIALRHAPPEVGVAVLIQLVSAPAKKGNGQQGGLVPAWHLLMTMSNPADLVGPKLRHYAFIGDGAPNLAVIPAEVARGLTELRNLARQILAQQS